ncbi:hypothetical protein CEXT_535081 [Caerostris extrusa]|uniref:Uncharacterized protein n=1 Tax=Caerostris extrusa TaxID=172846 RepID=A0AAV4QTC2_CAEEX|nr:hypothetical protein CEXT_535081 [Caerostris extrusa]
MGLYTRQVMHTREQQLGISAYSSLRLQVTQKDFCLTDLSCLHLQVQPKEFVTYRFIISIPSIDTKIMKSWHNNYLTLLYILSPISSNKCTVIQSYSALSIIHHENISIHPQFESMGNK